ncbi:hypothetical protein JHL18_03260 [Clostridium sp. YIM B02505]|uniref:Spo0E like sporulation regulatory protein n=1 Tax=Clostridium yunnanense TaxID=2800325 RepID=A0ABS1EJW4_9CLOT|nr:hypothetical protein [Clostridium yunnanense]MBK1809658.1 hypothetical protein [Clostridium yunnanense]
MTKLKELEEQLVNLKLQKRNLILAGKKTDEVDELIKEVDRDIKKEKELSK